MNVPYTGLTQAIKLAPNLRALISELYKDSDLPPQIYSSGPLDHNQYKCSLLLYKGITAVPSLQSFLKSSTTDNMQITLSLALAATALTASVAATPSGCSTSYDGDFQITVVKPTSKRNLMTRDSTCGKEGYLTLKLHEGNLIDSKGRTGYIASNYQFQFDGPPQENAASIGGYSTCQNGSLALAGSTIFYQCLSGDFYNLYDRYWAEQCQPIHIDVLPCKTGPSSPGNPVSQIGDGQPQAPSATPRVPISQISDGQPQAPTATPRAPIPQIPSQQPHAPTAAPAPPAPPAPPAAPSPVTQISDGQPQAPTAAPAPHGPLAPPAPPAPHGPPAPQAPSPHSSFPVGQISDGQPQVSTSVLHNATTTAAPTKFSVTPTSFVSSTTIPSPEATKTAPAENAGNKLNEVSSICAFVMAAAVSSLLL